LAHCPAKSLSFDASFVHEFARTRQHRTHGGTESF
jgi:hypothetical protein